MAIHRATHLAGNANGRTPAWASAGVRGIWQGVVLILGGATLPRCDGTAIFSKGFSPPCASGIGIPRQVPRRIASLAPISRFSAVAFGHPYCFHALPIRKPTQIPHRAIARYKIVVVLRRANSHPISRQLLAERLRQRRNLLKGFDAL